VGEVDRAPEERRGAFREVGVVVSHGAVEIGVEFFRELIDQGFGAAKTGGFADFVGVMCECGIAKANVLSYLCMR